MAVSSEVRTSLSAWMTSSLPFMDFPSREHKDLKPRWQSSKFEDESRYQSAP
jgi:hypothetical protein